jgi:branched-chain amino acid transport system permease protein
MSSVSLRGREISTSRWRGGVSPGNTDATTSIYLVAACILGGLGTLWGPVIGTVSVLATLLELGTLKAYLPIAFAAVLLVAAPLLPQGVVGVARQLLPRRWVARPGRPATSAVRLTEAVVPPLVRSEISPPELAAIDLVCRYGGVSAVDHVSLCVRAGSVHALIGSNGSGKTTLLNAISGFGRAQEGTVMLGGTDLPRRNGAVVARRGVSRTFQTPKLMLSEPVLTNVMIAADSATPATGLESVLRLARGRSSDRSSRAAAGRWLSHLGLAPVACEPAGAVPHGSMRLIEVARALAAQPRFVLLDEPAAGLTMKEIAALRDSIRQMAAAGIGVLLVEHNTTFVFEVADEVTVLHQGRVIAHGTAPEIVEHEEVIAAYLGSGAATRATIEAAATAGPPGPADTSAMMAQELE